MGCNREDTRVFGNYLKGSGMGYFRYESEIQHDKRYMETPGDRGSSDGIGTY